MIDLALVKAELNSVTRRATKRYEAEEWGTGQFDSPPYNLLPTLPAAALEAARKLADQAQSMGPRIVGIKKFLTIGDINWGGDDKELDELLRGQDLEALADEMFEQALYSGMLVGIVRRGRRGEGDDGEPLAGEPVIEPLTGHVEPLYDAENPSRVAGIFQAWLPLDTREKGWRVRIYDFDERTMTEWHKLQQPYMVGGRPAFDPVRNAPMPRFQILRRGRGRLPIGDMELALPLLKSDWSSQVRGDRAEQSTAFAQMLIRGQVDDGTNDRSPTNVIRVTVDGDAKYLTPGDLTQIHAHHDRKIDRLRRDANLPGGVLSGSNISGEALREDNMHAIADAKAKAKKLQRFLTDLARDFAREHNRPADTLEVTVSINKDFEAATALDRIVMLFDKGLLEFGAAVRAVSVYVPTWSDPDVEAYIKQAGEVVGEEPTTAGGAEETL